LLLICHNEHLGSTTHPCGVIPLCELHVRYAAAARSTIATNRHSTPNDHVRRRQNNADLAFPISPSPETY